jgi:hypothetical protein
MADQEIEMSGKRPGDNGGNQLNIGDLFEVGDLMMLIETLNFASTRARFSSGESNVAASERFMFLSKKLAELSPLPRGERTLGFEWFEIMQRARECDFYLAYLVEEAESYSESKFHLDIVCDDVERRVVSKGDKAEIIASLPGVMQYIREQARVTAEPLVMLNGLVELNEKLDIRRRESVAWRNEGRLDEATAAMRRQLLPASPYVHVVEAARSWVVDTMVEARFAVPVSAYDRVIAYIGELNQSAKEEYESRYSKRDFSVSISP